MHKLLTRIASPGPRDGRSAFTLIEMMVVIAIIMMALSLAIPLLTMRGSARGIQGTAAAMQAKIIQARGYATKQRKVFYLSLDIIGSGAPPQHLVTLYEDDGDGIFTPGTDLPVGEQYTLPQGARFLPEWVTTFGALTTCDFKFYSDGTVEHLSKSAVSKTVFQSTSDTTVDGDIVLYDGSNKDTRMLVRVEGSTGRVAQRLFVK
jgi:prepilin-type N-terminal cleavage/methylation domain-containing protein